MAVTLTARPRKDLGSGIGTLEYAASHRGRLYTNPTLIVKRGERVRIRLANALQEPTIVHWHGLSVSARNDGNGSVLAAPGEIYDYDFEIRNRSAMYWYHPHPDTLVRFVLTSGVDDMTGARTLLRRQGDLVTRSRTASSAKCWVLRAGVGDGCVKSALKVKGLSSPIPAVRGRRRNFL